MSATAPRSLGRARQRAGGCGAAEAASESAGGDALPEPEASAPPLVVDPFCGLGTVLALANAQLEEKLREARAALAKARRAQSEHAKGPRAAASSKLPRVSSANPEHQARLLANAHKQLQYYAREYEVVRRQVAVRARHQWATGQVAWT